MERMKLGLIGLGNMGRMYVRLAGQNPAVELVSVCDASRERLEQAVQENPGAHPYTDFDQMFRREKLEAVGIMTPDTSHLAPALAVARAGCHMLIEKPLAMNEAEARQIVAAVREAGVFCQVAYTNRWNPPYVAARELIRSGKLGEVTSLNARINNTLFTPTKMLSWAAKSSPAWFLMTHALDLARWLSGSEPVAVFAQGVRKKLVELGIDTWDTIHALFTLASGAIVTIESSWALPEGMPLVFDFQYEILGSEAALTVNTHDQGVHLITRDRLTHPVTLFLQRSGTYTGHLQAMFDGFVHSVMNNQRPLATEMDGLMATLAIEAVHRSLDTGAPVSIGTDI